MSEIIYHIVTSLYKDPREKFLSGLSARKSNSGKYKIVTDHISLFALAAKNLKSHICDPSAEIVEELHLHH